MSSSEFVEKHMLDNMIATCYHPPHMGIAPNNVILLVSYPYFI